MKEEEKNLNFWLTFQQATFFSTKINDFPAAITKFFHVLNLGSRTWFAALIINYLFKNELYLFQLIWKFFQYFCFKKTDV